MGTLMINMDISVVRNSADFDLKIASKILFSRKLHKCQKEIKQFENELLN